MSKLNAYRVFLITEGAASVFLSMIFVVITVYRVEVAHLNPLQLVLIGTALEATAFFFEVPTGVMADTYSRRWSVIIGEVLLGIGALIDGLFPFFATMLLAQVVWGIGYTFISGAFAAWVADELGEEQAGRAYLRGAQVDQIGSIIGTLLGVGLASWHLQLPIVLGGALMIGLGVFLLLYMPEHGFKPTPKGERTTWQAMGGTLRKGVGLVRRRPLLLIILSIGVFFGASSEGFDRLWQAHFLRYFQFPRLGTLSPIVWFGIINIGAQLISAGAAEWARRRLDTTNHLHVARSLLAINGLLIAGLWAFGLAGNFGIALAAYWAVAVLRRTSNPLYTAWLNQNVNPQVRATVLSLSSQADALGQMAVGPAIGAVGAAFGLRAAMLAAGAVLSPALLLFGRALRPGSAAPLVPKGETLG